MNISVFDMYRIGIGPSSSHTVGPMRAGRNFISLLRSQHLFPEVEGIKVKLMGSLAATGIGHATDSAVLLGLMGKSPSVIDVDSIPDWIKDIKDKNRLLLDSCKPISFTYSKDLTFEPSVLDSYHTNTLIISAFDAKGSELFSRKYYSVGGGFIETEEEAKLKQEPRALPATEEDKKALPYPFSTANELMKQCRKNGLSMEAVIRANEEVIRSHEVIDDTLDHIWSVMSMCIDRGLNAKGCLPGPLKVKRRANELYEKLLNSPLKVADDPLQVIDWINAYAFAVSEENAAGGRVVTAPTNGAAGVIPAVINYYRQFIPQAKNSTGQKMVCPVQFS